MVMRGVSESGERWKINLIKKICSLRQDLKLDVGPQIPSLASQRYPEFSSTARFLPALLCLCNRPLFESFIYLTSDVVFPCFRINYSTAASLLTCQEKLNHSTVVSALLHSTHGGALAWAFPMFSNTMWCLMGEWEVDWAFPMFSEHDTIVDRSGWWRVSNKQAFCSTPTVTWYVERVCKIWPPLHF